MIDANNSIATTKQLLTLILPEILRPGWDRRGSFYAALFFLAASIVTSISLPLIFKLVIDTFTLEGQSFSTNTIMFLVVGYSVTWMLTETLRMLRQVSIFGPLEKAVKAVSLQIYEHTQKLSLAYHLSHPIGAHTNAVTRTQNAIPGFLFGLFFQLLPTAIEVLIASAVLAYLFGPIYGIGLLLVLLLHMLFTNKAMEWAGNLQRVGIEAKKAADAHIVETLLHMETVKLFGNEKHEANRFEKLLKYRESAVIKMNSSYDIIIWGQSIIIGIGLLGMTSIAALAVINGEGTIGDFVVIHAYLLQFVSPMSLFGQVIKTVKRSMVDIEDIFELLKKSPGIADDENPVSLKPGAAEVQFVSVNFRYPQRKTIQSGQQEVKLEQNSSPDFIKDLNFKVTPGSRIAIVGNTGGGKSSILRLLLRLYDITSGQILIDGVDVKKVQLKSLRQHIGIVPQEIALFDGTLRDNIAYGKIDASDDEIYEAIRLAQLTPLLTRSSMGLETEVGQRGLKLSGGERQRIAIARLFLQKPKLLLFDEATSALDSKTEQSVLDSFFSLSKDITTIICTHRLNITRQCDHILVIDHGKIVEEGNFDELLKNKGVFSQLWEAHQLMDAAMEKIEGA